MHTRDFQGSSVDDVLSQYLYLDTSRLGSLVVSGEDNIDTTCLSFFRVVLIPMEFRILLEAT